MSLNLGARCQRVASQQVRFARSTLIDPARVEEHVRALVNRLTNQS
jgi:hypothetical protein